MAKLLTWIGVIIIGWLIWKAFGGTSLLSGITGSVGSVMQSTTGSQTY